MAEKGHLAALRKKQAFAVMDQIGPLLDSWEGIPYDVRGMPELNDFRKHMNKLYRAVDGEVKS